VTVTNKPNFLEWYRGKNVVVSGASGYIATSIISALRPIAARIARLSRAPLEGTVAGLDIIGEPADAGLWSRALPGADVVFHLAAQTSFYTAAKDPEADFHANVLPMRAILEAGRCGGYRPFIVFAGSSTEAGLPKTTVVDESHADEPLTIYDLHKLLAEKSLECYVRLGLARGTTLRLSNVFGPGPESSSTDRGILNTMIVRALAGKPLTYYGDGSPVRDYLFIDDVAAAFLAAGHGGPRLSGNHFVMGSGQGISLADSFRLVADRVAAKTGRRVEVKSIPEPPGLSPIESRKFTANTAAFRAATGWAEEISLVEGLDRTIEFLLAGSAYSSGNA
jgi:UDP-glucose 4-epimerase